MQIPLLKHCTHSYFADVASFCLFVSVTVGNGRRHYLDYDPEVTHLEIDILGKKHIC